MNVQYVPVEAIHVVWNDIAPFLGAAFEHSKGDYTLDQAKVYLSTGEWQALVALDDENKVQGAAAIHFYNRPNDRVAYIIALGGKLVTSQENVDQVKAFCASKGATAIEAAMRDATFRLWSRYGFEEKYRIVGVKL